MGKRIFICKIFENKKWYDLYYDASDKAVVIIDKRNPDYEEHRLLTLDSAAAICIKSLYKAEEILLQSKKRRRKKLIHVSALIIAYSILKAISSLSNYYGNSLDNSCDVVEDSYDKRLDHIKYIVTKNETINPEMKYYFQMFLNYLINSQEPINIDVIDIMEDKLMLEDYSDVDILDKEKVVTTLVNIMGKSDISAYYLSLELYESYVNHDTPSNRALLFENLNGKTDNFFVSSIINSGDEFYFDYLTKKYNFEESQIQKIKEILKNAKDGLYEENDIFLEECINKLFAYNYENYGFLEAMDKYFMDKYFVDEYSGQTIYLCNNNLFKDTIAITLNYPDTYKVYYNKITEQDITYEMYQKKFFDYMSLRRYDGDINIVFKEDRLMVYLHTFINLKRLDIPKTITNRRSYIEYLYEVSIEYFGNNVYAFLYNDDFNNFFKAFTDQILTTIDGDLTEEDMTLLIECILCLDKEVEYGHLTFDEYEEFISFITWDIIADNMGREGLMKFNEMLYQSDNRENIDAVVEQVINKYYFSSQDHRLELTNK